MTSRLVSIEDNQIVQFISSESQIWKKKIKKYDPLVFLLTFLWVILFQKWVKRNSSIKFLNLDEWCLLVYIRVWGGHLLSCVLTFILKVLPSLGISPVWVGLLLILNRQRRLSQTLRNISSRIRKMNLLSKASCVFFVSSGYLSFVQLMILRMYPSVFYYFFSYFNFFNIKE